MINVPEPTSFSTASGHRKFYFRYFSLKRMVVIGKVETQEECHTSDPKRGVISKQELPRGIIVLEVSIKDKNSLLRHGLESL